MEFHMDLFIPVKQIILSMTSQVDRMYSIAMTKISILLFTIFWKKYVNSATTSNIWTDRKQVCVLK